MVKKGCFVCLLFLFPTNSEQQEDHQTHAAPGHAIPVHHRSAVCINPTCSCLVCVCVALYMCRGFTDLKEERKRMCCSSHERLQLPLSTVYLLKGVCTDSIFPANFTCPIGTCYCIAKKIGKSAVLMEVIHTNNLSLFISILGSYQTKCCPTLSVYELQ